jgi:hypothetical protein
MPDHEALIEQIGASRLTYLSKARLGSIAGFSMLLLSAK